MNTPWTVERLREVSTQYQLRPLGHEWLTMSRDAQDVLFGYHPFKYYELRFEENCIKVGGMKDCFPEEDEFVWHTYTYDEVVLLLNAAIDITNRGMR